MTTDFNMKTINGQLNAQWDMFPSKPAMIFHDDSDHRTVLMNKDVRLLSTKMASYLFSHGVRRGSVVCNMLGNSLEREIVNFGILLLGAVVMHGDIIEGKGRLFWSPLSQAKAKFMVVSPEANSPAWKAVKDDVAPGGADVEILTRTPDNQTVNKVFIFNIEHKIQNQKNKNLKSMFDLLVEHEGSINDKVSTHEPAVVMVEKDPVENHYYLVERNHGDMVQIGQRLDGMLHVTSEDVIYADFPLSWLPGLLYHYITLGCTMVRSTLINCPPRKVVAEIWALMEQEVCTLAALEYPTIQMLSSHCEDLEEPHSTLRAITTTGHVRQSVVDAIGPCAQSIVICYSKIETGLIACNTLTEENKSLFAEGCVGDMTTHTGAASASIRAMPPATPIGEIMLDGALVTKQYLNDLALTKANFTEDGFLRTGDIGFYDEKRRLYVLGRKCDAIIRGNVPIFPTEIEEKVNQCPGIWKVKVVSIEDDKGMLQMCACVIPRSDDTLTIEGVKEFCRYQLGGTASDDNNPHMPSYIFFFDSFPTVGGKVNRRLLAYMATEILHGNPMK